MNASAPADARRPTLLEIAAGISVGYDHTVPPLPHTPGVSIREGIDTVLRRALQRPPCAVSFSGGRDSSLVLALATDLATREGLDPPIPVTLRFPDDADSDESSYQELVVEHLRLPDWQRITITGDMDAVGPIAGPILRRHGVTVPFNVFFHDPILRAAAGGSVLTGVGGDELFLPGMHHRANLVLSRRVRPNPLDLLRILVAVLPWRLRAYAVRARFPRELEPLPWLRPDASRALRRVWHDEGGLEPLSFARSVTGLLWPDRDRIITVHALDVLAADHDVQCLSPFSEPGVLASVVAEQGWRAFVSRHEATAALAGDLLPPALTRRHTKATFNTAFINRHTRQFLAGWDPDTLPSGLAELVDVEVLRESWAHASDDCDARTLSLLQAAWLAQQGLPVEGQPCDDQPSDDQPSDDTSRS